MDTHTSKANSEIAISFRIDLQKKTAKKFRDFPWVYETLNIKSTEQNEN